MKGPACKALLISAPASGQGKTTVTAALARHYRRQGRRVRVFKAGPDYLDPTVLAAASGGEVFNLDLWMGGEAHCQALLAAAAAGNDLILVEGVMGLFDGTPSTADLARRLALPVMAVIDVAGMAQTFGAVVHGLQHWQPALSLTGVFANRVGGPAHRQMLSESLGAASLLGCLPDNPALALPGRHLGLLPADEMPALHATLEAMADAIVAPDFEALPDWQGSTATLPPPPTLLEGVRIAVAQDAAFSFCYPANLRLLRDMGAQVQPFSPIGDRRLPVADAVYLPGGYPELHLRSLSANLAMHDALHAHHRCRRPIVAECGGMLYLLDSLADSGGQVAAMVGLLPGHAHLQRTLANLGLQTLPLPEGDLRGHTFHYSTSEVALEPLTHTRPARHHGRPEPVWRLGRLLASYMHFYLPSNPRLAAALFRP